MANRMSLDEWNAWVDSLDAKVAAKQMTLQQRDAEMATRPLPEGAQEQIVLTPEDEEILDRVWAEIAAEKRAKAGRNQSRDDS